MVAAAVQHSIWTPRPENASYTAYYSDRVGYLCQPLTGVRYHLYHIHSSQLKGLDSLFIRTMQGTTVTTAVNLTGVVL